MAVTLQEFLDKAIEQATLGLQPQEATALDAEGAAESLLPQVFLDTARDYSNRRLTLPRLTKTLTFANGTATITDDVLTGMFSDAVLYDADDPTKVYALVPEWEDFIRVYDTRIGYFTVRGGSAIYVIEPGETYVNGDGIDDTRTLVIAGVPPIPTTAGATIDAPSEFINAALNLMVERLRGARAS